MGFYLVGSDILLQCNLGLLRISEGGYSAGYFIIEVLWDLEDLSIAAILIMLGRKLRKNK
jgi:hypothetical protein